MSNLELVQPTLDGQEGLFTAEIEQQKEAHSIAEESGGETAEPAVAMTTSEALWSYQAAGWQTCWLEESV